MESTVMIDTRSTMNNIEPLKKTGLGERLKTAREALQLTEKEVAARLYLNVDIILFIENESFDHVPPKVFVRGYVRSYARLLNFTEDEITLLLQDLEVAMPSSNPITPPILPVNHRNGRYLHGLTCLIVLILCVLVSLWWYSHSHYIISSMPTTENPQLTTTMETSSPATTTTPMVAAPALPAHEKLQTPDAVAGEESDNQDEN
jgi:cytoskeleton protein RodZ